MEPERRRRILLRPLADWNEPMPGGMKVDRVARCGDVNRDKQVNRRALTDIPSDWTDCAPLAVRDEGLLDETLNRTRLGSPFVLRALDVDNGCVFVNKKADRLLPELRHRVSRPNRDLHDLQVRKT